MRRRVVVAPTQRPMVPSYLTGRNNSDSEMR